VKVLLIGAGGREHALAWKLAREHPGLAIVAAPGNPGIAAVPGARCVPVRADDVDALAALAASERPDYTLVGPEAPLALGLVDRLRALRLPAFGPTRAAARIETSKAWAKALMRDAGVPTAAASTHTDPASAKRAAAAFGAPVVVKASGLAAGKGVVVAATLAEAEAAIDGILVERRHGDAGAEVLVEAFMAGEELSVFYLTDGHTALPLVPAQDHKRLLAGDRGPNTGGMGAYAPVSAPAAGLGTDVTPGLVDDLADEYDDPFASSPAMRGWLAAALAGTTIVEPVLAAMRDRRCPFTGVLYAGLMLTAEGPQVVEFNCRFGDPETQAVLPLLDRGGWALGPAFAEVAAGGRLPAALGGGELTGAAVATVLAAAGYPDTVRTGDPITLPPALPEGVTVFHAGTRRDASGALVTAGGRVLAVTAVADTFAAAQQASRDAAARVHFEGRQYRDDIGWREASRG
jgi:phosphoribosylamine--glycine ligase